MYLQFAFKNHIRVMWHPLVGAMQRGTAWQLCNDHNSRPRLKTSHTVEVIIPMYAHKTYCWACSYIIEILQAFCKHWYHIWLHGQLCVCIHVSALLFVCVCIISYVSLSVCLCVCADNLPYYKAEQFLASLEQKCREGTAQHLTFIHCPAQNQLGIP